MNTYLISNMLIYAYMYYFSGLDKVFILII